MSFESMGGTLGIGALVASVLCLIALGFAVYRTICGPTAFDRVMALDLIGGIGLCIIVLFAILSDQQVLLDAAFGIAVVSFLGTVALARFLLKGGEG